MAAGQPDFYGGKTGYGQDAVGTEVRVARGGKGLQGAFLYAGDDERGSGRTGADDAGAGTLPEGEGRIYVGKGGGRLVPGGRRGGGMPADGGRHAVCEHRTAVRGGQDGEVALGTGFGGGGLLAAGGQHAPGGTYPRAGGGGVFAPAEGAGPFAGMPGHRGEPVEPPGGADVRPPAGTEASARERGH